MSHKVSYHNEADPKSIQWMVERKAWVFQPRGLNIIWGNDPRSWLLPRDEGKPVEMRSVCWLEVTGSANLETGKKYRIGFKISFKPESTGWDQAPVFISAKIGKKGKTIWKRIRSINQHSRRGESPLEIPNETDGPFEISIPPTGPNRETTVQFGLYEVWTGRWKSGLMIHEASVQEVA